MRCAPPTKNLNGYVLDFSKIKMEELLTADIEAFNGKYEKLIRIRGK
jgi:hypothetical protein